MKFITRQDFTDVYQKLRQRGGNFLLSKLNPIGTERTKSAFDESSYESSNWWIIPTVRDRWNLKISGDVSEDYEAYTMRKHFAGRSGLRMLSIGSGVSSHEMKFAAFPAFESVACIDLVPGLLDKARQKAEGLGLANMEFICGDIRELPLDPNHYDVILFHASLHHMSDVEGLLSTRIKRWLKPGGTLLINEYVGPDRLQYDKVQIKYINRGINLLPESHRRLFRSTGLKTAYYGVGYLRMLIADPSECVESSKILPVARREYTVVEEKPYGGNLLMAILKDISHHFVEDSAENRELLQKLFQLEDNYLAHRDSDFMYGVYQF